MPADSESSLPLAVWQLIERLCTEYEQALRNGAPISTSDLLPQVPPEARSVLLRELDAVAAEYRPASPPPAAAEKSTQTHIGDAAAGFDTATVIGAPAAVLPPLEQHPRYRLVRCLGHGSRCVTWQAEDRLMRRSVVLRCLHAERLRDPQLSALLSEHFQRMQSWRDPHITTVYEVEPFGGATLVIGEYHDGTPLTEHLAADNALAASAACAAIHAALLGVHFAASQQVLHGRLVPKSLVRGRDGATKIVDYPLCPLKTRPDPLSTAPEILAGGTGDVRSDVYSLGCILAALLSPADGVPPKLGNVVEKMTAARPADRYFTAASAAAALRPWTTKASFTVPKRLWWTAMIAMSLCLLLLWGWHSMASQQVQTISTSDRHVEFVVQNGLVIGARDPVENRDYLITRQRLLLAHANTDRGLRITLHDGSSMRLRRDGDEWIVIRPSEALLPAESPVISSTEVSPQPPSSPVSALDALFASRQELVGEVRRYAGFAERTWITRCAFTPDGKHVLATAGLIREWETDTGKEVATYAKTAPYGWGLDVSPDGNFVVTAGDDAQMYVWLRKAQKNLSHWPMQLSAPYGFESMFSPDGRYVLAFSHHGPNLVLWDWQQQKLLRTFETYNPNRGACFSRDGKHVVVAGTGATIYIWQTDSGELLQRLDGHSDGVSDVACTPDGRLVVSGAADKTLKVWDWEKGDVLRTLRGHTASLRKLAIAVDGRRVFSCADDRTARVWDLQTGQQLAVFEANTDPAATPAVIDIQISPDGKYGLTCAFDGTVRLWRLPELPTHPTETPP